MNTKLSFVLLVSIIALLIVACQPTGSDNSASIATPIQPPSADNVVLVPVTGEESAEAVQRDAQEPRLWSGEIFLSGSNSPDQGPHSAQNECVSEDDLPRRHGGCIE